MTFFFSYRKRIKFIFKNYNLLRQTQLDNILSWQMKRKTQSKILLVSVD